MGLEIEFVGGHPPMRIGATARLTVNQQDASGGDTRVALTDVSFQFGPVVWGKVEPTDEPGVGLLEVIALAESDDVLDEPVYTIDAVLNKTGGQAIKSKKHLRIIPQAVEIALAFEVGRDGTYKGFALADLKQEIDWSLAHVGDPQNQSLIVRDGVPILRLSSLRALPATVRVTFPSGDQASLIIEGDVQWWDPTDPSPDTPELEVERPAEGDEEGELEMPPPFPEDELIPPNLRQEGDDASSEEEQRRPTVRLNAPPRPVIQQPSPQALQAAVAARTVKTLADELHRAERYAASFSVALKHAGPEEAGRIHQRITGRLQALRPRVEAYQGPGRDELLTRLESALQSENG